MRTDVLWGENKRSLIFLKTEATPEFWDDRWIVEDDSWKKKITSARKGKYWSRLLRKYLPDKNARILEGGCGLGHLVDAMTYWGYEAIGVDFARETIKKVKEVMPNLNVRYGDVRCLEFEDKFFDAYFSGGVIEHFWDGYESILTEMHRVLKPGGYGLITFPCISFLDRVKILLGGYRKYTGTDKPKDFYQFGLDIRIVKKDFEKHGFKHICTKRHNGWLGLERILPCFSGIYDETIKFSQKGLLARRIVQATSLILALICGHSVLLIMRKG